ncbi:hypothetical protein [Streptomyces sp. ODS05-4]|uniref:hypothetical protein n=1 Tax=Streptomyces sp. ODS05-4 TaxID=2944939 RepID=UPI00210D0777|nr:hypothetical protein [Streptomyces sp. ODS05-4]
MYDELAARGWLTEEAGGGMALTARGGEAGRLRARERSARVDERAHQGIEPRDHAVAVDVLRRMVADLGGDADLT